MIDPDEIRDADSVEQMINKVSKKRRGIYAQDTARKYLTAIGMYGGFDSNHPDVDELVDCMDRAISIAKSEYLSSKDKKRLESLGVFCIQALTRKNAVECLRAVGNDLSKSGKRNLEWLEDESKKQEHIKRGLCDKFDEDYRKKK